MLFRTGVWTFFTDIKMSIYRFHQHLKLKYTVFVPLKQIKIFVPLKGVALFFSTFLVSLPASTFGGGLVKCYIYITVSNILLYLFTTHTSTQ